MVVLTAAIVASGKTLLARQFVEMTRLRVEGLLSAFPKLLDSGRDHTHIETETVRYVYQPMDSLFLLLVTNKSSNILEDLETLRLLAKVVQDCCQVQVSEDAVIKHAFDIIFAFDEVISFGHRESVTLSQIKTCTEMDSQEEKIHQMIEQSKMNEAKEIAKKKQVELQKTWAQQKKEAAIRPKPSPLSSLEDQMKSVQGASKDSNESAPSMPPWSCSTADESTTQTIIGKAPKKSMTLSKKRSDFVADIFGVMEEPAVAAGPAVVEEAALAPAAMNPLLDPVNVEIDERITAKLTTDGSLQGEVECQGQFQITVIDEAKAGLPSFKLNAMDQQYRYKGHPNLNKASQANSVLELKDASKALKANTPTPFLKWRMTTGKESFLPVSLSCWPSATAEGTQVVLEIELTDPSQTIEEVHIRFPAPPAAKPSVQSADIGEANYDDAGRNIHWHIPTIDKNVSSGTLEFSASADQATLLPFTFEATRKVTSCPIEIIECYHLERKDPITFGCKEATSFEITVGA